MSEASRAFRRFVELFDKNSSLRLAARMVADELERDECKTAPVETPGDQVDELREAAIELLGCTAGIVATPTFWIAINKLKAVIEKDATNAE